MKIPKTHFERFKKEFNRWVTIFGLTQYRVVFYFKPDKEAYASIQVNEEGKLAMVYFTNMILDFNRKDYQNNPPETHAKHEAIHLLIHRLRWLGGNRYIGSEELGEEYEAVVTRLEKVL